MMLSRTPSIDGQNTVTHFEIVSGNAFLVANIFRDFFGSIRDIVGGRSAAHEAERHKAKDVEPGEMREPARHPGAHAIVGIELDHDTIGVNSSMLMVSGTAVVMEPQ